MPGLAEDNHLHQSLKGRMRAPVEGLASRLSLFCTVWGEGAVACISGVSAGCSSVDTDQ